MRLVAVLVLLGCGGPSGPHWQSRCTRYITTFMPMMVDSVWVEPDTASSR